MAGRKVLSKYYPPDFVHSRITRNRGPKSSQLSTVRLMTPFPMRCCRCGHFIYTRTKFNARNEVDPKRYLGIQIFRFHIKCPECSSEIIFRTDPQNTDYEMVSGATRNFESWRSNEHANIDEEDVDFLQFLGRKYDEADEQDIDRMQLLEMKAGQQNLEMETADALDEIRMSNLGREKFAAQSTSPTSAAQAEQQREQELADEREARLVFRALRTEMVRAVEGEILSFQKIPLRRKKDLKLVGLKHKRC
jgi:hypothetical protein